jgi:hypothetical protein
MLSAFYTAAAADVASAAAFSSEIIHQTHALRSPEPRTASLKLSTSRAQSQPIPPTIHPLLPLPANQRLLFPPPAPTSFSRNCSRSQATPSTLPSTSSLTCTCSCHPSNPYRLSCPPLPSHHAPLRPPARHFFTTVFFSLLNITAVHKCASKKTFPFP